jgi:hypothetical protein
MRLEFAGHSVTVAARFTVQRSGHWAWSLDDSVGLESVKAVLRPIFFFGPFRLLRIVTTFDEVSIQGCGSRLPLEGQQNAQPVRRLWVLDGEIDRYHSRPYTKGNEVPYVRTETRAMS